ncbi:hypothetical protein MCC93_00750 [Morococcus cerebrosus]|uniref:Uncharacterized protein n=1 Tax=Morococcus cerebrosus TaxID=1056807 RepID=A0A0C1ELU1_9NEIS|nr:hypothetical protein MCC93_00750 [Morococcus cerebrosus]
MLYFLENWAVCAVFFGLEGVNVFCFCRTEAGASAFSDDPSVSGGF